MPEVSDIELLRDYSRQGSEAAFAELVKRHLSLVYSAALRHVGIAAHAEEITQAVFVILARKAASLRPDTVLEAWLYETTRLASLSFLRGERRRQFREQEAYMQSTLQETADAPDWPQLAPLLDEAMARLNKKDREVVVLRFFMKRNVGEVAAAMKTTEAAAQSRAHRALEKLRKFFTKRGVTLTSVAVAGAISAHSVQAAPAALAKTVMTVAIAKGAPASISTLTLIHGAMKIMAWTKAKTVILTGATVLLAAGATTGFAIKHQWLLHREPPGASLIQRPGAAGFREALAVPVGVSSQPTLQGHWTGSNSAHPGQTCTLKISGDKIEYQGGDQNDWLRGRLVLNDKTEPHELDITILEPAKSFVNGIYRTKGDTITISVAPHGVTLRPVNFTPGPEVDVLELQRD